MTRVVMCVGGWIEDYEDFIVTEVNENETDDQAIDRATSYYGPDEQYYIRESKEKTANIG